MIDPDTAQSITGWQRAAFVAVCVAWCYAGGLMDIRGPCGVAAERLGRISYAIYLLHPLVFKFLEFGLHVSGLVAAEITLISKQRS
jgi:peptidoglycan/LPS O-acetylase OafA/YrhL